MIPKWCSSYIEKFWNEISYLGTQNPRPSSDETPFRMFKIELEGGELIYDRERKQACPLLIRFSYTICINFVQIVVFESCELDHNWNAFWKTRKEFAFR